MKNDFYSVKKNNVAANVYIILLLCHDWWVNCPCRVWCGRPPIPTMQV